MEIKRIGLTRGHMVLETEDGKYAYMLGEMTIDHSFYIYSSDKWYWLKKEPLNMTIEDELIDNTLSLPEKEDIIKSIFEYNKDHITQIIVVK